MNITEAPSPFDAQAWSAKREPAKLRLARTARTHVDNPFAHVAWVDDLGIPHFAADAPDPVPCENPY